MKAHELRAGDQLTDSKGRVAYTVTNVRILIEVRFIDGGSAERVFTPNAEVPHVRPAQENEGTGEES